MKEKRKFPIDPCLDVLDYWKSAVLDMTDSDWTARLTAAEIIRKYGLEDPYPGSTNPTRIQVLSDFDGKLIPIDLNGDQAYSAMIQL